MPRLLLRLFPFIVLLLTSCAVTRYDYVPPSGEAGQQCIASCASARENCQANEYQRAQWAQEMCQRRNWGTYRFCVMGAFSRREAQACERFLGPCWGHDNTWRCDEDFRACYVACGGRVTRITE